MLAAEVFPKRSRFTTILSSVLVELVVITGVAGAPEGRHAAIGPEDVVDEAGFAVAAIEDHGPRAVPEEHGGRAVPRVHDGGHGVGPDEEDAAGGAALEDGGSDGGCVREAR